MPVDRNEKSGAIQLAKLFREVVNYKLFYMNSIKLSPAVKWLLLYACSILVFTGCQKKIDSSPLQEEAISSANNIKEHGHLKQAKTFSSDVIVQWLNLQLDMLRVPLAAGTG